MPTDQDEALAIFKRAGALLEGHFILRSGLRSERFFQCARVCERMDAVTRLVELLLPKLAGLDFETVLAPAMGGLVVGQEIARQSGARFLFAEKENDRLVLRRGFELEPGERVLVAEDVITRGGRVEECLQIVGQRGAEAAGLAVLVDRSEGQAAFPVPLVSLLQLSFPTYEPDQIPERLRAIPPVKPGS